MPVLSPPQDMSSSFPRGSLPSLCGQRSDSDSRELLHKLPALQRPPIIDLQAMLKRRIKRKEPSLLHLKVREQMNRFPGWRTEPAPSKAADQEPVHLPPLPSTKNASDQQGSKNVALTPPPPRPPFSNKSFPQLAPTSQTQLYECSSTEDVIIDNKAVISVCEDHIECQSLECWEKYYKIRCKLLCIPFFARYKTWKPMYVWRTNVRAKKIRLAKQSLQNSLFVVSPSLSPALMDIRKMCCQITETGFCHMKKKNTYTLQEFQDTKIKQLQEASNDLEKFHELVKEVTVCACGHYLLEAKAGLGGEKKILSGFSMSFFFNRIIHLIRLIDYLVVTTLHSCVVNTVDEMLTLLQVQAGPSPSDVIIQSWSHDSAADPAEKEMNKKSADIEAPHFHPVFMSELMLDTNSLIYKPSKENFQDTVADFIERFKSMVMSVKALSADPVFDSMIQPEVDEVVDKYEKAPALEEILKNDGHLKSITNRIQELFQFAFAAAEVYANMFEHFRLVYRENESLDLDELQKQDPDVSFFEKVLTLCPSEHEEAARIQQERRLGVLLVDTRRLKEKLESSSLRRLKVINHALTQLAQRKVDTIMADVCEAEVKLGIRPSTTAELVDFLTFLEETENRIGELKKEQETVSKMYSLIDVHAVPTPPEDLVRFATLEPFIERVMDETTEEKDSAMHTLCRSLQMDIKELNNEKMKVELKLLAPQILDINADSSRVRQLLTEIQLSIEDLKSKSSCCISYQRKFQMEVTEFESLEQLMSVLKLTHLLWDSLEQWDSLQKGWQQSTLEQLDMEQFSSQVNNYSKYVSQLEEGLPRNSSVPCLKQKVEAMMQRLPVITDLHNACMKPKHWKTLKSLVGTSLNVDELTLAALEELNIFRYAKEIHEVSEQASGEATVETIISKVEDLWKDTEFSVLPHGDSKDSFILGGMEDIQGLLDDSIINVGTVASSCYVAPITWRVNELLRQLTLFKQTLDEWLTCQRNWLYLESMFLAPDTRRQLPAESDVFLKVDTSWKKIMAKVKRMPNAFNAATQSGLLETLQENNALLNQIQKYLEAYLESRTVVDQ